MRRCKQTRASRSLVAPAHFSFRPSGSFIHQVEEVLSTPLSVYVGRKTHPVPFAALFAIAVSRTTLQILVQDWSKSQQKSLQNDGFWESVSLLPLKALER